MSGGVRKAGLYRRLLLYFVCISLLPILLLGTLAIVTANRLSVSNIRTSLETVTEANGTVLDSELEKYRNSVETFCQDEDLIRFLKTPAPAANQITRMTQTAYLIMAGRIDLLDFYIANAKGEFLLATSAPPVEFDFNRYHGWSIFRALDEADNTLFYTSSYTDALGAEDTGITVCRRVTAQSGETLGYVMLNIPQRALTDILPATADMQISYAIADKNLFLVLNQFITPRAPFIPEQYRTFARTLSAGIETQEYPEYTRMVSAYVLPETGLLMMANISTSIMLKNNAFLTWMVVVITIVFASVCMLAANGLACRILQPIDTICDTMAIIEQGNLDERVLLSTNDEFETMADGFNHMIEQLDEQFKVNLEKQNRLRLAELKNLQAQIAPHFLYNTLESIKWLAKLKMNDEIQTIVAKLGILLKSGMDFKKDMIPLRDEMMVVESYLAIQHIRYEDRFVADIQIEDHLLDTMVPNLVIQPIVENALVHGIENKVGRGRIRITGYELDGDIHIVIEDDGNGIGDARMAELAANDHGERGSESIGLWNVDERLKLYFGRDYGISIYSVEGEGTRITVVMPLNRGDNGHV
ncbi:sensor histidine kinase [Christensenellaceae bacterium OttesenSCG-928-L17]|nr:sensor histidine kinase [Christensenellaceae bacterium OttesenSCG-928-L17]